MRLAIDPTSVKLPAKVDAIATTSQARCQSASCSTKGLRTSTAGTLLTRFESTAVTALSGAVSPRRRALASERITGVKTAFCAPATTMNRPANMTSSLAIDLVRLDAAGQQQQ